MTHLRLLADDLTGALDSAAAFVPLAGPVSVTWHAVAAQRSVAFDCGTRDLPAEQACESMERFSHLLDDGAPAFKKIDSLLRGHVALELAVCMRRFRSLRIGASLPVPGPDHPQRQAARSQWRMGIGVAHIKYFVSFEIIYSQCAAVLGSFRIGHLAWNQMKFVFLDMCHKFTIFSKDIRNN